MKKLLFLIMSAGLIGASASVFGGYTTYSANNGYQQPHYGYIPYYHGNLDYDYNYEYYHSDNDRYDYDYDLDYDYDYSDDDNYSYLYDYDIRYDNDDYYVDNSITHSDTYNITAHEVDIDNNHYYANYGPYRAVGAESLTDILHNLPSPEECSTQRYQPRHDDYFTDLRLTIPKHLSSIQKYRIRRSDGDRSQWYIPGKNDVDHTRQSTTAKFAAQRMRAYFGLYEHEISRCTNPVSKSYSKQNNYYYPTQSNGHYTHDSYANGYQQQYRDTIIGQQPDNHTNYRRSDHTTINRNTNEQGGSTWKIYEYHSTDSQKIQ